MSSSNSFSDELENSMENLAGLPVTRSPVEESFYESYIIQSRIAVENLYASNVLSGQQHMKEVKDLTRQRKVKLSLFEREKRKVVKRMEELRLKQKAVDSLKRPKTTEHNITGSRTGATKTKRMSLLPLTKASTIAGDQPKKVKSPVRLGLRKTILSKSCNDLKWLHGDNTVRLHSHLILPAIQNGLSGSLENISDSPFVTHNGRKFHNDPHRTLVYRGCKTSMPGQCKEPRLSSWKQQPQSDISTKVKWVSRS